MREPAVVIGASGHARVLVDITEESSSVEIVGFVSMETTETLYKYQRLGNDDVLPAVFKSGIKSALVAIGDNRRRKVATALARSLGFGLISAISSAAVISKYAHLGAGLAILPGAIVNAGADLGDGVIVNTNASVDHDCTLGSFVHVAPGSSLAGCVHLEEGVFLGTGTSVIPGVRIGSWTTVGSGATVVSDLPSNVVAVGVPAAVLKNA